MIRVKRNYEKGAKTDSKQLLVDRLWPRGFSRKAAREGRIRPAVAATMWDYGYQVTPPACYDEKGHKRGTRPSNGKSPLGRVNGLRTIPEAVQAVTGPLWQFGAIEFCVLLPSATTFRELMVMTRGLDPTTGDEFRITIEPAEWHRPCCVCQQ